MDDVIHTSIHSVEDISTTSIELRVDKDSRAYYVRKISVETENGTIYCLTLFSDNREGLEVR